ncbi:hypothetical protein ATO6_10200 [Oceanicola sp. 22II-s10i]|uniref:OsmC family protein n=1 Tax=Oceanicola sp. 22II-s10i TaxID=1317116 RepID=UPI000B62C0EA|nr:OsmC family protein [Oceanicola sp. 22II-s10i]OWU84708.1 hypothetical protein ATO6_10200 [Oceanicola sp. 22II-s10i]
MEYPSTARATGGRKGRVWTETGSIDSKVIPPGVTTPGVTPEELLAGAWAACYGGAYAYEANLAGVPTDPEFHVEVVLSVNDGVYEITKATLTVMATSGDPATLKDVADKAHIRCPVSKVFANGMATVSVGVGSHG